MSSKIKVDTIENVAGSGNVSLGSGHNLVVPGDITVNTNKLFVDASTDYIGIGTTSPATATGGGIDIHRNGGSSVRIDDTTNSVTGELQVYSAGLNLATVTNHNLSLSTNNSVKMTIDGSGRVIKPLQPAFHIQGTCVSHSAGGETAVVYASNPTIKMNIGNHGVGGTGASTSGKFTCPVAGMYYFEARWYRGNTGSPTRYMGTTVKKNGATFVSYHYNNAAGTSSFGDQSVAASGIIQCAANDVLQQYVYSYSADADPATTMQIYLLG